MVRSDIVSLDMVKIEEKGHIRIQKFNDEEFEEELELFSNDAKPLFLSILIALTVAAIREVIIESKLDIKEIDYVELSRLLSFCLEKEQQEEFEIQKFIMQRIHPTAKKLKVTGKELLTPWKEDSESNNEELRFLFAVAVSEEVRYKMSNHSTTTFIRGALKKIFSKS